MENTCSVNISTKRVQRRINGMWFAYLSSKVNALAYSKNEEKVIFFFNNNINHKNIFYE